MAKRWKMAAPTLRILSIAGQDVSAGQNATITPTTPGPWMVEGTVQHANNKQVTGMWYQIAALQPQMLVVPPDAALPGNTVDVAWSFNLPGMMNNDYSLSVFALNADGVTQNDANGPRLLHYAGFPVGP